MHIAEGVLSPPVIGAGWVLTGVGLAVGLKRLKPERMPEAALFSAAFFLASLIHIPVGPSSVHLLLNGIIGLFLGWSAFPVIFVALFLQAVFFQFGGLVVLGVNTFNMAAPAVLVSYAVCPLLAGGTEAKRLFLCGILVAVLGVGLSAVFVSLSLLLSGGFYAKAAFLLFAAHLPVVAVESVVNGFALLFVGRISPELLRECGR